MLIRAGVGEFVFAGGDALAMLREAWRQMERA
jgi:methylmalonyl-CoA mutase